MTAPLLEVRDLKVYFPVFHGFVQRLIGGGDAKVHAVDGVTFSIPEGQVFGLVGESGCGKTTIAKTLVGLVRPTAGQIVFRGKDVTHPDRKGLFHLREQIQLIYQDPHAALSPAMTVLLRRALSGRDAVWPAATVAVPTSKGTSLRIGR